MQFDIDGARKAGYSDAEIAGHLAKQANFDLAGAKNSGYNDLDIVEHLTKKQASPAPAPRSYTAADALGVPEAALSLGSGAVGAVAGGLAGLAQGAKNLVSPGMPAGDRVRQVQDALTYQPRTLLGKQTVDAAAYLPEQLAEIADTTGGKFADAGFPAAGAAVNTGIQALPAMLMRGARAPVAGMIAKSEGEGAIAAAQNATRDRVAKEGRAEGYTIPPSTVAPGLVNQTLESVAGKVAVEQTASIRNQKITDTLARRGLDLPPTTELNAASLAALRNRYGKAYEAVKKSGDSFRVDDKFRKDIAALGDDFSTAAKEFPELAKNEPVIELQKALTTQSGSASELMKGRTKVTQAEYKKLMADQASGTITRETITPTAAVELVKKLRFDASKNYNAIDDPAKATLAKSQRAAANAIDDLIERNLTEQGKSGVAGAYKHARTMIAKVHDVEAALQADGHVSARVMAKIGEHGYLDGPLKAIGEFSGAFPKATNNPATIGSGNVHNLRAWGAAGGAAFGAGIGGPLGAALGGGAPWVIPPAVKGAILSPAYGRLMATPGGYGPGALSRILEAATAAPEAGMLIPAIPRQ